MRHAALAFLLYCLCTPLAADNQALPGTDQVIDPAWRAAVSTEPGGASRWVNRLALSDSAYLRQHADNPIDWREWSEDTLALAESENRLVFLSIGYASCHWCHVMERESFADEAVAGVLNKSYVSIKVDRELQPDVDAYYLDLVRQLRGESGWPISVILTPDRLPILAANYLSKSQLITAAERYAQQWQQQPDLVRTSALMFNQNLPGSSPQSDPLPWNPGWLKEASDALIASVDPEYGGFGTGPKFPSEVKLQFLLNQYKRSGDAELRNLLIEQLDRIMVSGLTDPVFGGLFRYTTDRAMQKPHFEKMLYNQAMIVSLFTDAADWLETPRFGQFANEQMAFADRSLRLDIGLAAALDAEYQQQEGGYYLWPETQLADLPQGLTSVAFGNNGDLFLSGRPERSAGNEWLRELRGMRRAPPRRIDNRITAWNALWIKALLTAGRDQDAALLANDLWDAAWKGDTLSRMGEQAGYLDDYVHFSGALWNLYLRQGEPSWKSRASQLDRIILDRFMQGGRPTSSDPANGVSFNVDLSIDREMPSPVGELLRIISYHQTSPDFISADQQLRRWIHGEIARSPEAHLAVLQALAPAVPASEAMIALGHGRARLNPETKNPDAGTNHALSLVIQLGEGWHINAAVLEDEQLVPTQVMSEGRKLDVRYPQSHPLQAAFSDRPIQVYDGTFTILIHEPEASAPLEKISLVLQACSDRVCLLPEELELRVAAQREANQ